MHTMCCNGFNYCTTCTNLLKRLKMKKNMGNADRIVRFVIAIIIGILYWQEIISGTLAIILGIISVIFIVTSFVRFCPLYAIIGLNTCPKK